MADKIQTLLVSLEARINQYQSQMAKALKTTNTTARKVESRFATMNKSVTSSFNRLAAGFATVGTLRAAQELIDASTRIENSLKVAGLEGEDLTRVYDKLFDSAQKNAAPVEALVGLYGSASQAQKELGATSADLVKFSDNIAMALRVSGKSAQESSGALMQLGQALGSARVQAEEFNSINEGARPILQAAAAGIKEAGGSVSKLKALVNEGKVSNKAFFDGIQAGAGILVEKLAGAETTVSQGFIRLQNVLIDTAGKFDAATNSSVQSTASLDQLADVIQRLADNKGFLDFVVAINDFGNAELAGTAREIEGIVNLVQSLGKLGAPGGEVDNATGALERFYGTFLDSEALGNDLITEEQMDQLRGLVEPLLNGEIAATDALAALEKLWSANPDMSPIFSELGTLISQLGAVQVAAENAAVAADLGSALPGPARARGALGAGRRSKNIKTVSLDDYEVPGSDKKTAKTPAQKFEDELAAQALRNSNLREETALQATLNPLVNDYGYAIERLRIQQELENAATAAGLELTPERKKAIAELAEGYATATVEAQKLTEAQANAADSMSDWFALGKSAARGFIDDLVEGKSAAEALGNVFNQLGNKLIDLGLTSIFGGGGGDFGLLGQALGFASGTANTGGVRGQARGVVHGQEAVIPLPNGGKVPVQIKMPTAMGTGGGISAPVTITIDATGADPAAIARLQTTVAQMKAELPATVVGAVRAARKTGNL